MPTLGPGVWQALDMYLSPNVSFWVPDIESCPQKEGSREKERREGLAEPWRYSLGSQGELPIIGANPLVIPTAEDGVGHGSECPGRGRESHLKGEGGTTKSMPSAGVQVAARDRQASSTGTSSMSLYPAACRYLAIRILWLLFPQNSSFKRIIIWGGETR